MITLLHIVICANDMFCTLSGKWNGIWIIRRIGEESGPITEAWWPFLLFAPFGDVLFFLMSRGLNTHGYAHLTPSGPSFLEGYTGRKSRYCLFPKGCPPKILDGCSSRKGCPRRGHMCVAVGETHGTEQPKIKRPRRGRMWNIFSNEIPLKVLVM